MTGIEVARRLNMEPIWQLLQLHIFAKIEVSHPHIVFAYVNDVIE